MKKAAKSAYMVEYLLKCSHAIFLILFICTSLPQLSYSQNSGIEVQEFNVKLIKKSRSGKVLLFSDTSEHDPKPGKILLIKQSTQNIAAVRVLKNYKNKFAAKILYSFQNIELDTPYEALKKTGSKINSLIEEREKREQSALKEKSDEELAKEISPDDAELDRGIPAMKKKEKPNLSSQPMVPPIDEDSKAKVPPPLFNQDGTEVDYQDFGSPDEQDESLEIDSEQDILLEPFNHAISLQYGNIKNVDKTNNPTRYNGFGVRYAYNFWKHPFFKKHHFQDLFSMEVSGFYYSISGFQTPTDQVSVLPLIGTIRYHLLFGDSFSVFTYVGLIKNIVLNTDRITNPALLESTNSAIGLGVQLKIAPGWAIRADYGIDMLGIGLVLKF